MIQASLFIQLGHVNLTLKPKKDLLVSSKFLLPEPKKNEDFVVLAQYRAIQELFNSRTDQNKLTVRVVKSEQPNRIGRPTGRVNVGAIFEIDKRDLIEDPLSYVKKLCETHILEDWDKTKLHVIGQLEIINTA